MTTEEMTNLELRFDKIKPPMHKTQPVSPSQSKRKGALHHGANPNHIGPYM